MADDLYRLLYGPLGASKIQLQEAIWHGEDALEPILDRAIATVIEAGKPEHAEDQFRPCVHEDLLLVYQMVDLPGYAGELERIAGQFTAEIAPSEQCHFCMANLHVQGLYGQRRYDDADKVAARYLARVPRDASWAIGRRLDLICLRADVAAAKGDRDTLRDLVTAARADFDKVPADNNVLRAAIRLAELRLAIADDDAAAAQRCFGEVIELVAGCNDFALAARATYGAFLGRHERWADALAAAEPGIAAAARRNAYRWHAELLLVAIDAHAAIGRDADRAAAERELAGVLAKLKSRDLDGRVPIAVTPPSR